MKTGILIEELKERMAGQKGESSTFLLFQFRCSFF